MTNTVFSDARADALDVDFGSGRIADCRFISCGNDAIDVSGSSVQIERVVLDGMGDTGISAGEESRVSVAFATVRNAEIALASKDRSELVVRNVELEGCRVGFAAYQQKPEFGPAVITASSVRMEDIARPFLIERGSTLVRDENRLTADLEDVEGILYGAIFGTLSP